MAIGDDTLKQILNRLAQRHSGAVVRRISSPRELVYSPVVQPLLRLVRKSLTWRDLCGVIVRAVAEAVVRGNLNLHVFLHGKRPVRYLFSRRLWTRRVDATRRETMCSRHVVIGVMPDRTVCEQDARVLIACSVAEVVEPPREELGVATPRIAEIARVRSEVHVLYLGSAPERTIRDRKTARALVRSKMSMLGEKRSLVTGIAVEVKRGERRYETYLVFMSRGLVVNLLRLAVSRCVVAGQLYITVSSKQAAEYNATLRKVSRLPLYKLSDRVYICLDPVLARYIAAKLSTVVYMPVLIRREVLERICPDAVRNSTIYIPLATEVSEV